MNDKIDAIIGVLKEKKSLLAKAKQLSTFAKYYLNLQREIKSGKIFHKLKNQNNEFVNFTRKLTPDDVKLFDKLFSKDVKKYLENTNLESNLDFTKLIGVNQVNPNVFYSSGMFPGAATVGKTIFYLPTKIGLKHEIILNVFSFVPLTLQVEFENQKIAEERLSKLKSKTFNFKIFPKQITKSVSEFSISTDKLWLPSRFLKRDPLPAGVLVKSINVNSHIPQ